MERPPGLGELLRHLCSLVDDGATEAYCATGLPDYRPRYTPVMRSLEAGATTITEITQQSHLTQGAISQTVGLMIDDGLLERYQLEDARMSGIRLTTRGRALLRRLQSHWDATFEAIGSLEAEIGHPLLDVLDATASALARQNFSSRLLAARTACKERR